LDTPPIRDVYTCETRVLLHFWSMEAS